MNLWDKSKCSCVLSYDIKIIKIIKRWLDLTATGWMVYAQFKNTDTQRAWSMND